MSSNQKAECEPKVRDNKQSKNPKTRKASKVKASNPVKGSLPVGKGQVTIKKFDKPAVKPEEFIVPHLNRLYPKVKVSLAHSMSYTEAKVKAIADFYPITLAEYKTPAKDNGHPYCAAMRALAEAWSVNALIAELRNLECKETTILDVGGSINRHSKMGRDYIWCCVPNHDDRDIYRKSYVRKGRFCEHDWETCNCVKPVASMSVHSLYYIKPETMFLKLMSQEHPIHYAVVHYYPEEKGTMMMGEMQYVKSGGKIRVKADGNLREYVHDDCSWMEKGSCQYEDGCLVWENVRRFGDSHVVRFVASHYTTKIREDLPEPISEEPIGIEKELDALIEDNFPYVAPINTKNREAFINRMVRNGKANYPGFVKLLVSKALTAYHNQKEMLPEVTDDFIESMEEREFRRGLGHIGFSYSYWVTNAASFAATWWALGNNAIKIKTKYGFQIRGRYILALCLVLWAGATWYFNKYRLQLHKFNIAGYYPFRRAFTITKPKLSLWPLIQGKLRKFGLVVLLGLLKFIFGRIPPLSLFSLVNQRARVDDYCCDLADRQLDATKCSKIAVPETYYEECEIKPAAYAMVYIPSIIPYFPRRCIHNKVSCIRNKLLHDIGPVGKYHLSIHPILLQLTGLIKADLNPLTWDQWLMRFPPEKQCRFRKDIEYRVDEHIVCWNESSVFLKFEAMSEPKYPRPIVSSSVEFNFQLGRYLIVLGELLAHLLPKNILFPIHNDASIIAGFYGDHHCKYKLKGDFTSFDSSQREEVLSMWLEFLLLCGVPSAVVERERTDLKCIKIHTRDGLRIKCRGIRCSGRSATLLCNTFVTLNTYCWLFPGILAGTDAIMVKGDDALTFNKEEPSVGVVSEFFRDNGLIVKAEVCDDLESEFCSSIFVPSTSGFMMVPKPGKILAKTLWCKNLEYSMDQMQDQFVGVLKGLSFALGTVPGIKGLYANPIYQQRFGNVDAFYQEYNEYSSVEFICDQVSLEFMCDRYGLLPNDFSDLEQELSSGFPIRVTSHAALIMASKDWATPSDNPGFVESSSEFSIGEWISPLFEEMIRSLNPVYFSLLIGSIESYLTGQLFNLLGHIFLGWLMRKRGFLYTLCFHYAFNFASRWQFNIIMARRKKNVVSLFVREPQIKKNKNKNKKSKIMKSMGSVLGVSRLNPFLPIAEGIRVPDEFGFPTGTGKIVVANEISTSSLGYLATSYAPLASGIRFDPLTVGSTLVWTGGALFPAPQQPQLQLVATAYRVVSWGIRITGESSLTAASGHIWIGHAPAMFDTNYPFSNYPSTEAAIAAMPLSEKFSLTDLCQNPVIVPGRQLDDSAFRFRTTQTDEKTATSAGVESMNGWANIVLFGSGLPQSAYALNVEVVLHIEFLHNSLSELYAFVDSAPCGYNPSIITQAANLSTVLPIAIKEEEVDTVSRALNSLTSLMNTAEQYIPKMAKLGVAIGGATVATYNVFRKSGFGRSVTKQYL